MTAERDRWQRVLRGWLLLLNVGLMLVGVAMAMAGARRAWFLLLFVPIAFAPFAYARLRLQGHLGAWLLRRGGPAFGMAGLTIVGTLCDAVMVAQLLSARSVGLSAWLNGPVIGWVGPVWFSAHALLFLGFVLLKLGRLVVAAARRLWARPAAAVGAEVGDVVLGRRQFLQQAGLVGAAAPFAVSLAGVPLSYDFRVEERELRLPDWPRELDGLRVAHLSDIHVGGAMNRQRLLQVAALTAAAKPDLVLHTGDFLTHRSGDFDLPLYEALARLRPPHGQWACFGNHDYDDPQRFTRRLRDAGVTVLRDRIVRVDLGGRPLEIAGLNFFSQRDDRRALYAQIAAAWAPRDGTARLLLNHDPSGFAALPDGCADLVLSGHTHGGHIGLQLGPDRALTVVGLAGIPDQGVFERERMRMFVTRCVGFYGYPMRLGIPPEIAILTLRRA